MSLKMKINRLKKLMCLGRITRTKAHHHGQQKLIERIKCSVVDMHYSKQTLKKSSKVVESRV